MISSIMVRSVLFSDEEKHEFQIQKILGDLLDSIGALRVQLDLQGSRGVRVCDAF